MLAALPKSAHPGALSAMREISNAEDIDKAQLAIKALEVDYGAKYPKAVAKITDDADVLLELLQVPSRALGACAPRIRSNRHLPPSGADQGTKSPGSRAAGIAMAYKLIEAAQSRWRAVNAPHLVAVVRAGAVFHKGKLLERPVDITPDTSNAEPETAGSEVA